MSVESILETLSIIFDNHRFSKESLKQPGSLQDIYTLFLMEYDFSYELIPLEGSPLFRPTLLELLSGLQHLFSSIATDFEELNFGLTDLCTPVLSRTTKFLWSLCNCFMHSNNIYQHETPPHLMVEDTKDEFANVESQIQHYRQYIQDKHMSRGIEKLEIDTLMKALAVEDETLQMLTKESNELNKKSEGIASELEEQNAIYEETNKRLKDLKCYQEFTQAKKKK
eukprot:TRINITY_DN2017_c0_g1_i2.p1 TRINITY_DN2017_c0_g1~~TRINITY_DN2017_c0_g1_i2.p1  ORF type:complete len:225 (+),score=64.61 TRINITY_DN2017_c0_g1_i2:50-724(+)